MSMGLGLQSKRRRVTEKNCRQGNLQLTPPVCQPSTHGHRRPRPKAVPPLALHRTLLQPFAPCFQVPEPITHANLEPPALQFQIAAPPERAHDDAKATSTSTGKDVRKDQPKLSRTVTLTASTRQECVVDSSTSIPRDLFESLLRLGVEARRRGQHMTAFTDDEYPFRHGPIVRRDLCIAAH